ncbi:MAG: solute carrier family 26 protein [Myxococcota bacterium]
MVSFRKFIPILDWGSRYNSTTLRQDTVAGLTTAVMLIPQAMAYAMLAGLPAVVGLYASIVPLAVYAILGTSRQLAVGPVAMVSLLVASGIGALVDPTNPANIDTYVAYAVVLALMVGVLQLSMGVIRLGFVVNLLSHPVISGFTSAAALIIGFSQLKHLLGISIPRSHHIHTTILKALEHLGDIQLATLALGAGSVLILVVLKRFKPNWPRALMVVALGTVLVWGFDLNTIHGVAIVGTIEGGFPPPSIPTLHADVVGELAPIAITIALVSFMESISVAKAFATRNGYDVEPNQELIGLGAANIGGAFFGAYPVTGGFSRTAVNAQAGAQTGMASLITAAVVLLSVLFLTPLFTYLPKAVLAAIIMTAVFGLIDTHEVKHLWKVDRTDLALLILTFMATLSFGIEEGILIGVSASLLRFILSTTRPHTAVLGQLPNTTSYRNIIHFPEAQTTPGLLIVRVDAPFYFGNVAFLKETLRTLETEAETPLQAVIIDACGVDQLDSSADTALHNIALDYRDRNIDLYFAHVKGPVRAVMAASGFTETLGAERFFLSVHDAVQSAMATLEARAQLDQELGPDVSAAPK